MELFVKDSQFYRKVLQIAVPVTAQSMITIGVSLADTVMVAKLGDAAGSGVAQANAFMNVFQICCMGLGMGASVLVSRFWGEKDVHSMKKAYSIMLRLSTILILLFALPTLLVPNTIMVILTDKPSIREMGLLYLKWMIPCFICQGYALTSTQVLRSVNQTIIPLISSIGAFILNVALNYILIFGKFGAPEMGVEGAAIATMTARISEFVIICGYTFILDKRMRYRVKDLFMKCSDLYRTYLKICIPVFVSDTLLALGNFMVNMIMGRIGQEFLMANSITTVTQQLSTIAIQGICHSSSIITGQTLGEGKVQKAKDQAWTFLALSAIVGFVGGFLIIIISQFTIPLYDKASDLAKVYAQEMKYSIAIIVVFQSMNSILTKGVLRGGGDTIFLMVADILFLWVLSVPLGALAGLVLHLNPFWIYFCLKIDQIVKAGWCIWRLKSGKWIKKISVSQ